MTFFLQTIFTFVFQFNKSYYETLALPTDGSLMCFLSLALVELSGAASRRGGIEIV